MHNKGESFNNLRFFIKMVAACSALLLVSFLKLFGFILKAFWFPFKNFLVSFLKLFVCFLKLFGGCLIKTAAAVQEIRNHLHPHFVQLHKMIKGNFIPMCTFREGQNKEMVAT